MHNEHKHFKFKKDRYAKKRGGNSQFYNIFCACGAHIALYQKDGTGALVRMYQDRIFAPDELTLLRDNNSTPSIQCNLCHTIVAVQMIYEPENRVAFRLIRGTFSKKKTDGTYPI